MSIVEISRGTSEDAAGCAVLEALYCSGSWKESDFISAANDGSILVVARSGGAVVGCFLAQTVLDEGQVVTVAVERNSRRCGIARRMLTLAEVLARTAGVTVFYLEVRRSNTAARALYESFGFTYMGERKSFYTEPVEDAVTMKYSVTEVET